MRKILLVLLMPLIFVLASQHTGFAAASWGKVVDKIEKTMTQSLDAYKQGDLDKAKKLVNDAYYGVYEKEGMELTVSSTLSGRRGSTEEYKFSVIKKLMTNGAPEAEIKKEIDELVGMLREDAVKLGGTGKQQGPSEVFWPTFLILVREGFEAILVIGAITAYLNKSGNGSKTTVVYYGSFLAILASLLTAIAINQIFNIGGANQEIMEGVTVLIAVVVLLSVCRWMISKADTKAWQSYIEGKVQHSVSGGNALSLGLAAFLAVYREGAEVVLFYQALLSDVGAHIDAVWMGFGAGCVALAVIYGVIHYGSMKIPLKPFFLGTSIFMYCLAVSFAGSGVNKLQAGGVVGVTLIPGMEAIDLLGIYPTWETLLPQIALVLLAIGGVMVRRRRQSAPEAAA